MTENYLKQLFGKEKNAPIVPLVIFEMANNHMGDLDHGLKIIEDFREVSKDSKFKFAFKFQYRDLETFIHPDFKGRTDLKYIKRFTETGLNEDQFLKLKKRAEDLGFITIVTPFDEISVDLAIKHNYEVIKIASASFTDWVLLEKIVNVNKPIIASAGGAQLEDIDKVVSFFQHRHKEFALMHCVGQYPTPADHLELNQIDLFKQRYPSLVIGFSTHEEPTDSSAVQLAIAKGAKILEKHVAVESVKYKPNAYSATPEQIRVWLKAAEQALSMCGVVDQRSTFPEKELADIRQFQRGVYAKTDIAKGQKVNSNNTFFAFPNSPSQVIANDFSKYTIFTAQQDIKKNEEITQKIVSKIDSRQKVHEIVLKIRDFIKQSGVAVSSRVDFEISHHYGIEKFYEFGAVIITVVNREYAKKLIVMLPGQKHPAHKHEKKEETFHVLYGEFDFELDGKKISTQPGDVLTVERGVGHSFSTQKGGVFEEVSTTHIGSSDSFYEDESINNNPARKTYLSYWID